MANILMCFGEGCAIRAKCYRHTAPWSIPQSWMYFERLPSFRPESGCSCFQEVWKPSPQRRKAGK